MSYKIIELNSENNGTKFYDSTNFNFNILDKQSVYLVWVTDNSRQSTIDELRELNLDKKIIAGLSDSHKQDRFNKYGKTIYGEIALLSMENRRESDSIAVIIRENVLVIIQPFNVFKENEILELLLTYDVNERPVCQSGPHHGDHHVPGYAGRAGAAGLDF